MSPKCLALWKSGVSLNRKLKLSNNFNYFCCFKIQNLALPWQGDLNDVLRLPGARVRVGLTRKRLKAANGVVPCSKSKFWNFKTVPALYSWNIAEYGIKLQQTKQKLQNAEFIFWCAAHVNVTNQHNHIFIISNQHVKRNSSYPLNK